MSIGALISSYSKPYVHSNYYHFINFVLNDINDNGKNLFFADTIQTLNDIIADLKTEENNIYQMLGISGYTELNKLLFDQQYSLNKERKVIAEVLNSAPFRKTLSIKSGNDKAINEKAWKKIEKDVPGFFKSIVKQAIKDGKTLGDLRTDIMNAVSGDIVRVLDKSGNETTKIRVKDIGVKLESIQGIEKTLADKFISNIKATEVMTDRFKGGLMQIINNIMEYYKLDSLAFIQEGEFITAFKTFYNQYYNLPKVNSDTKTDGEKLAKAIYNEVFKNSLHATSSLLSGDIGEGTLKYTASQASIPSGASLDIMVTGPWDDKKIAEKIINKTLDNVQISDELLKEYILDYNDPSKQSQTDVLIVVTLNDEKCSFRVQSKNALLEKLDAFSEKTGQAWQDIPILKNETIFNIINSLTSDPRILFTEAIAQRAAYIIANFIWFNTHKSVTAQNARSKTSTNGRGDLQSAQQIVNQLFSTAITRFTGVAVDKVADSNALTLKPKASNLFFFLTNRAIYPVSEILSNVVKKLDDIKNQQNALVKFTINSSSANFAFDDADQFHEYKLMALKAYDTKYENTYDNISLLSIGQTQGGSIIQSATGNVNLKINISDILNASSYFG